MVEVKQPVKPVSLKTDSDATTLKVRVARLRSRGTTLVSKLEEKSVFDMKFLADIDPISSDGQCRYLQLTMSIDYAVRLMRNFETEVKYWLNHLEYGVPITRWQEYSSLKDYECPDEDVKKMYDDLFRRFKPVFEEFGVEFDLVRGRRIIVPHTKWIKKEHHEAVGSNFELGFGGYILNMKPCLSSLAKAINLLTLLKQEETNRTLTEAKAEQR